MKRSFMFGCGRIPCVIFAGAIFAIGLLAGSCDKSHDSHHREVPELPGNGGRDEPPVNPSDPDSIKRPGVDDKEYDFSKELSDATWRYTGSGVELNYDGSGILFTTDGVRNPKTVEIIHLDGNDRISCAIGEVGADSVVSEASLTVNSAKIALSRMLFKKVAGNSEWYHIVTADNRNHVLVIPAD